MSVTSKSEPKQLDGVTETQQTDEARREFLNKFGKMAAVTPIALSTLMSPKTSAAPKSCRGNGSKKCR